MGSGCEGGDVGPLPLFTQGPLKQPLPQRPWDRGGRPGFKWAGAHPANRGPVGGDFLGWAVWISEGNMVQAWYLQPKE